MITTKITAEEIPKLKKRESNKNFDTSNQRIKTLSKNISLPPQNLPEKGLKAQNFFVLLVSQIKSLLKSKKTRNHLNFLAISFIL